MGGDTKAGPALPPHYLETLTQGFPKEQKPKSTLLSQPINARIPDLKSPLLARLYRCSAGQRSYPPDFLATAGNLLGQPASQEFAGTEVWMN